MKDRKDGGSTPPEHLRQAIKQSQNDSLIDYVVTRLEEEPGSIEQLEGGEIVISLHNDPNDR